MTSRKVGINILSGHLDWGEEGVIIYQYISFNLASWTSFFLYGDGYAMMIFFRIDDIRDMRYSQAQCVPFL